MAFDIRGIICILIKYVILKNDEVRTIKLGKNGITISTFENDPEWKTQYGNIIKFLEIKGNNKPNVKNANFGEYREDSNENFNCNTYI